jgi:hypothetical protein
MRDTETSSTGWDDAGELQPTTDPDWKAIEVACGEIDFAAEIADMKAEELESAFKVIRALMGWVHNGSLDVRGIAIRAIIVGWIVLPHLQQLSLTEIATRHGLKKQSIGRWLSDKVRGFFKKFPTFKWGHMNFE